MKLFAYGFALLCALLGGAVQAAPLATNQYDVVVYGGVPCGVAAAVAAARNGASVLLLEPKLHVGGLNTSGINTAESEHMLKWMFGGISLEFYERLGKKYGKTEPAFYFESKVAEEVFNDLLREAKVEVHFGERVERVEKQGVHIQRIELTSGTQVAGKVFIDATYEGDLMARAGVTYTWGREGTNDYHESLAGIRLDVEHRKASPYDDQGNLVAGVSAKAKDLLPGSGDRKVMDYNYRLCFTKKADNRVPIPAPAKYDEKRYVLLKRFLEGKAAAGQKVKLTDILDLYPRANDKFEVNNKQAAIISLGNFGGQFGYPDGSYADQDAIYADHKEYTLGLLYFLANDASVPEALRAEMNSWGLAKDEFADNGNWPYYLYIREARRMKGRYVMTQRDVQDDRHKPDAIGMSSHFIDCHHVERVAISQTEFVNEGRIWRIGYAYQIPYRALTPQTNECDNLLVPGAASYTHVAFCTYRLESVWMIGGHAAGTAAAMAAKQKTSVQEVDVPALQKQLVKERQVIDFIPGQPEKFQNGTGGPPEF